MKFSFTFWRAFFGSFHQKEIFVKFLAIAAALASVVAATPSAAVVTTFATHSAVAGDNVRFVNSGTSPTRTTDAVYYTISTPGSNVAGSVLTNFNFINTVLAPFVTNVSARYTLNAVVAKNSPATVIGNTIIQSGLSGSFSFLSTSAITVSGPGLIATTYAAGSNLLSGIFNSATLVGSTNGTAGSTFATGALGMNLTFTSDFLTFAPGSSLDRSTAVTAINPATLVGANGALRGFKAVTGGQFSADPAPKALAAVPEPAVWAMLLAGFGFVGVSMRRRTVSVAA
jgi:hypothetical protein